jgi:hypothetical protein
MSMKRRVEGVPVAMLLAGALAIASGCTASSRSVRVPSGAPADQRNQYAGKTLECAGSARRDAIIAGVAGSVAGGAASVTSGIATVFASSATTPGGAGLYYGLSATSCALGATSLGCAIYAFFSEYGATQLDQRAGKIFANQSDDACVEGALPMLSPTPATPSSASN